ncbi:MAG: hypothetical protein WC712_13995 [Candidatus Brocadiia bacterium]
MSFVRRIPAWFVVVLLLSSVALAEEKSPEQLALEAAEQDLASSNWLILAQAISFLADKPGDKVNTPIDRALESSYPYLQMIACQAAGTKKLTALIPKLVTVALNSSNRAVVDAAGEALSAIDEKKAWEAISKEWNDRADRIGENFSRCLRYFKETKPTAVISRILRGPNAKMGIWAVEAATVLQLKDLEKELLALKVATDEQQAVLVDYFAMLKDSPNGVKYLAKQIEGKADVALRAGTAIADLKFDAELDGLLKKIAKRASSTESAAALKALLLKPAFEDPRIASKLLNGPSDLEKLVGCSIYSRFPDKTVASLVRKIAKEKNSPVVRISAARALAAEPDSKENFDTIRTLLATPKDEDNLPGLYGATFLPKKEYIPYIINILASEPSVKTSAAAGMALNAIDPAEGLAQCEKLYSTKKIKPVASIPIALKYLPYAKTVDVLISMLPPGNPEPDASASDFDKAVRESLSFLTGRNFTPTEQDWKTWWAEAGKELPVAPAMTKSKAPFFLWNPANSRVFSLRSKRPAMTAELDKDRVEEQLLESALMWLANFQDLDGKWSPGNFKRHAAEPADVATGAGEDFTQGVTAAVVAAYLQAGYSPVSGPYSRAIRSGLDYLDSVVCADGSLLPKSYSLTDHMMGTFEHAMVGIALGYAVAAGCEEYRGTLQRIVCNTSADQSIKGGWGKNPGSTELINTSTTTTCAELLAVAIADGVQIPAGTIEGVWNWYNYMVSEPLKDYEKPRAAKMTQEEYDKQFTVELATGWTSPGFIAENTANAVFILHQLGVSRDSPRIVERLNALSKFKPDDWFTTAPGGSGNSFPLNYLLYVSRAKQIRGGAEFKSWYIDLGKFLGAKMDKKGSAYGSLNADGNDARRGGRIYATAVAALSLATPYAIDYSGFKPVVYKEPPKPVEDKPADKPPAK